VCWNLTAEEVDGVGDMGVRRYNSLCMGILGGLFKHILEICLFH